MEIIDTTNTPNTFIQSNELVIPFKSQSNTIWTSDITTCIFAVIQNTLYKKHRVLYYRCGSFGLRSNKKW